jgi:transposase
LVRFNIRNFNLKLREAATNLEKLRGPEGESLPPNTLAELRRDVARRRVIREQIKALQRLKSAPQKGTHPMMQMLARTMGIGAEPADMLVHEVLSRKRRDHRAVARDADLTGKGGRSIHVFGLLMRFT